MSIIKEKMYAVLDGNSSALKTYIEFKKIEAELKEAMEAVKEEAVAEAKKHGKSFIEDGAKIEIRNSSGKWSYNHIPEWRDLDSKMENLQEQLKHAYKANATLINESTGEITLAANYREGGETIFVTLQKENQKI